MMGKEKVVALVSLCLVLVLGGLSAWLYVRTRNLEDRISGLENTLNDLTEQYQGLQDQLAEFASIFSRTEQLTVENVIWNAENADATFTPTFTVRNTGTSNLALVAVFVNNELAKMTTSSNLLSQSAQATVTVTRTEGFTLGTKYEFTFLSASGSQYVYISTAP